jgi:hypothetical protein
LRTRPAQHPSRRLATKTCRASTTPNLCRLSPGPLLATTGRYVISLSLFVDVPMPRLASRILYLSRAPSAQTVSSYVNPTLEASPDAGSLQFQTNCANQPLRPIAPLRFAPLPHATNRSASFSGATIAANVAASSAGSIPATKSGLTSSRGSIQKVTGTAPATVVTAPSASGSISGPAEATARAPTATLPSSPSRRQHQRSDPRRRARVA